MPLKLGVWKLGGEPTPISFSPVDSEDRLEEALHEDISILDPGLMVVGRQVDTAHGTRVDLLAMNSEGDLATIELKQDRTTGEENFWTDQDFCLSLGVSEHETWEYAR
jgi:hypothetical protein